MCDVEWRVAHAKWHLPGLYIVNSLGLSVVSDMGVILYLYTMEVRTQIILLIAPNTL